MESFVSLMERSRLRRTVRKWNNIQFRCMKEAGGRFCLEFHQEANAVTVSPYKEAGESFF